MGDVKQVAYYCDEQGWSPSSGDESRAKAALLFFDGIAISINPDFVRRSQTLYADLTATLIEKGLLWNLWQPYDPDSPSTKAADIDFESFMRSVSSQPPRPPKAEIDWGKALGGPGAWERILFIKAVTSYFHGRSVKRDWDSPELDVQLITLPGTATYDAMTKLLSRQRPPGSSEGIRTLSLASPVFADDLRDVGVDLTNIPLEELLDFRRRHGEEFRRYANDLRLYLASLLNANDAERALLRQQREEALRDAAAGLRKTARLLIGRKSAVITLAVYGAAWSAHAGDPTAGALGLLPAIAEQLWPEQGQLSTFSYILDIKRMTEGRS